MDDSICIDRIEGDWAVCEDSARNRQKISMSQLPDGVREGDCLRRGENGSYYVEKERTKRLRSQAAALQKKLFKKGKNK